MDIAKILNQELTISRDSGSGLFNPMLQPLEPEVTHSLRPLRRQAVNRAKYDLSASWLNEYLSEQEENDDQESGVEGDTEKQERKRRAKAIRSRIHMEANGGEDSDSDEYKEEEEIVGHNHRSRKRRRSSADFLDTRKKKPRCTGRRKQAKGERISKTQIQGLVNYVLHTLNWEEAALSGSTVSVGHGKQKVGESSLGNQETGSPFTRDGPTVPQRIEAAERLREHWMEVLSKKIVAMYRK